VIPLASAAPDEVLQLHFLASRRSRKCCWRSALGGCAAACASASASAGGSNPGRRDVDDGVLKALSCNVVRPRRSFLGGVEAQVCSLALRPPFHGSLVPVHTRELRGAGLSVLNRMPARARARALACRRPFVCRLVPFYCRRPLICCMDPAGTRKLRGPGFSVENMIDAILEAFAVCVRRFLLRLVKPKALPVATRGPLVCVTVPGDALELRGVPSCALSCGFGNNAVLEVLVVRARRRILRGVTAQVFPLARRLPFSRVLVPADALERRGTPVRGLGNNVVLEVLALRARRSFLRGVEAKVLPLKFRQPLV